MKDVLARWLKASRALKKEDQVYGQRLAKMAKLRGADQLEAFTSSSHLPFPESQGIRVLYFEF